MNGPKQITREFILEGAVRAIQASRVFLIDAIFAYENDHLSSAYIMGIIAAEQLGRAMWMVVRYHEMVDKNELITDAEQFARSLRNIRHRENLRKGVMSYKFQITPEMEKLNEIIQSSQPNSPEQIKAFEQYSHISHQYYEDMIEAYHLTREQIQYVNPDNTYAQWTSPTQVTQEQVKKLLQNVGTDNRVVAMTQMEENNPAGKMVDQLGLRSFLQDYKATWLTEDWNKLPEQYRK